MTHEISLLSRVDWDFPDYPSDIFPADVTRGLHWYMASLVPAIPLCLIRALTSPGDIVCDPFCGSGTTLLEAYKLGRNAIGVDSNHISFLIASLKSKISHSPQLFSGFEIDAFSAVSGSMFSKIKIYPEESCKLLDELVRNNPDISKWYHIQTLKELVFIATAISKIEDINHRNLLLICLSDIARICSGQTRGWGYIADNMYPKPGPKRKYSFRLYLNKLIRTKKLLENVLHNRDCFEPKVICGDSRLLDSYLDAESISLILSSPPYLGTSDYASAFRLSYPWLNLKMERDKQVEIGARWKRSRVDFEKEYFQDMDRAIWGMRMVLKKDGYLCLVLPGLSSRLFSTSDTLKSRIVQSGFDLVFEARRNIPLDGRYAKWQSRIGVPDQLIVVYKKKAL